MLKFSVGLQVNFAMKIKMNWNYKYFYLDSPMSIELVDKCRRNVRLTLSTLY